MGIVDVFDAMTTNRPYRSAATGADVRGELRREADRGRHRADLVAVLVGLAERDELPRSDHGAEGRET